MTQRRSQKKWFVVLLGVFGASLLSAGVFAASTITLNSGNAVNLGAGAAAVDVCDSTATINTLQTFDSTTQRYNLTTITINDINTGNTCAGKTLEMAFVTAQSQTYRTTWSLVSGTTTYTWGGSGSGTGFSSSTLPAINTAAANISTFAVSAY